MKLYKKWWFWLVLFTILLVSIIIVYNCIQKNKIKSSVKNIGKGASDYIKGIENANSHLEEFSYNYETGQTEYHPLTTYEKYENIREGTSEEEVISIFGNYDKKSDGENTYMLEWGNEYTPVYGGYWIQIIFDKDGKMLKKYQYGLD